MNATKSGPAESTADREIIFTRVFDAPRELVWEAWTNPTHVVNWWGPNGFSTMIEQMDVRPGGVWRHVMHGPDGTDYPNHSVFSEVTRPERLSYSHGGAKKGGPPAEFEATITFEEQDGKTKLTMRMVFPSAAARDKVIQVYGAIEGGKQTLQRLHDYLPEMEPGRTHPGVRAFVITRVFDAPRELVWKACTEPERLKHWWGPKGFEWVGCKLDLRAGGLFHYSMRAPNGLDMWGRFVYREVAAPERLVFINSFSDADGGLTRHPMSSTWPLEVLNTMKLSEQNGRTVVTLRGMPINASEQEIKTFEAGFESMQKGFGGTFDQLAGYLAKA